MLAHSSHPQIFAAGIILSLIFFEDFFQDDVGYVSLDPLSLDLRVFILLVQNTAEFFQFVSDTEEISEVRGQIGNALDLSVLVQKLQEERAAVALAAFLNRTNAIDTMEDLQIYVLNDLDISRFTLLKVSTIFPISASR